MRAFPSKLLAVAGFVLLSLAGHSAEAFLIPTDISGNALWLDASDADTLFTDAAMTTNVSAGGDIVRGWADKSGTTTTMPLPRTQPPPRPTRPASSAGRTLCGSTAAT